VRRNRLLLFLIALAAAPAALAGPRAERKLTIPDVTAFERALYDDAKDGKLDSHDPVTAGLVASGASKEAIEKFGAKWKAFLAELVTAGKDKSAREKAELALVRLHEKLMPGGYDFTQNDMTKLLASGSYNCVTSALAYQAAGAALGLDVRGVLVPSHVYVRVVADGVSYDVETTSAGGFLLAQDDEAYQKFLVNMQLDTEKKSGRKILTGAKFTRRETDAVGVLALLYANRGAIAIEQGDQKEAIGLFARSALLAEDDRYARDSRDLLLAQAAEKQILEGDLDEARRLLKFAIKDPGGDPIIRQRLSENVGYAWELEAQQHLDAKRYESAFSSLTAARDWTKDPAIDHNQRAILNMWGLEELGAKRYDKAADVFYRAMKSFPADPDFTQNLKAAYSDWVGSLVAASSFDAALERSRKLMTLLPGDPQAAEIFANAASRYGESLGNKGDWNGAIPLLEEARKTAPGVPYLKDDLVVAYTNAGVTFAKAGEKDKAEAAWKRAVELDPNANAAKQNLERLTRR